MFVKIETDSTVIVECDYCSIFQPHPNTISCLVVICSDQVEPIKREE
jgi:hypothetical protein